MLVSAVRNTVIGYLIICSYCNSALQAQTVIEQLTFKTWEGTGTLLGQEASFSMQWKWELEAQFLKLAFHNTRGKEGQEIKFAANAYYKISKDSLLSGSWFDSRGVTFPLKGTIKANTLTIFWGNTSTEQGKTIYTYDAAKNQFIVLDYILNGQEYLKFATATYR